MVTIKIDRRTFYAVLVLVGAGAALLLGILVGRQMAAPAETPQQAVAPLPLGPQGESEEPDSRGEYTIAVPTPLSVTMAPPTPDPTVAALPRITIAEAAKLVDAAGALFVDVRTASEYEQSHIKGAMNVPEFQLGAYLSELPKDRQIILYCA